MRWLQQALSALVVLGFAFLVGEPKKLLGLGKPEGHWLSVGMGLGLALATANVIADQIAPTPSPAHDVEYFAYEATMPGIGEGLGFRGLFLGLLATAGFRRGWPRGGGWVLLTFSALPFALGHLLEVRGFTLLVTFSFTFMAGIAFAWCRMTTATIWPCIIAHNVTNVVGGLMSVALAALE